MISRLVDSALRPYSPGGKLNGFPATLRSRTAIGSSSLHRLRLGLPGCLVERYGVSQLMLLYWMSELDTILKSSQIVLSINVNFMFFVRSSATREKSIIDSRSSEAIVHGDFDVFASSRKVASSLVLVYVLFCIV